MAGVPGDSISLGRVDLNLDEYPERRMQPAASKSAQAAGRRFAPKMGRAWHEAVLLARVGLPAAAAYLASASFLLVTLAFAADRGAAVSAGVGLGITFTNLTGASLIVGAMQALDTLQGQSFGAKSLRQVGVTQAQAVLMGLLLCLPILLLWLLSGVVLAASGMDGDVVDVAQTYAHFLCFGVLAQMLNEAMRRWLSAQLISWPMGLATVIALGVHVTANLLLVPRMAAAGLALSYVLATTTILIVASSAVYLKGYWRATWPGRISRAELLDWPRLRVMARLAAAATVQTCSEWWAFEVILLLAGHVVTAAADGSENNVNALAAMAIMLNTCTFAFMLPLGLSTGVTSSVANELGAHNAANAKFAATFGIKVVLAVASAMGILTLAFAAPWGHRFTADPDVHALWMGIVPFTALFLAMDALQCVLTSVLRAAGRQALGARINLVSYWLVGLVTSSVLAFPLKFGLRGLVLGMVLGLGVANTALAVAVARTDWAKAADEAVARTAGQGFHQVSPEEDDDAVELIVHPSSK